MDDGRYDFDCNSSYADISASIRFPESGSCAVDPWFLAAHPLHEQRHVICSTGDGEGARGGDKKRKSSICAHPEQSSRRENSDGESMPGQLEVQRSKGSAAGTKADTKRAALADVSDKAVNTTGSSKRARVEPAAAPLAKRSRPAAEAKAAPASKPLSAAPMPKATTLHKAPTSSSSRPTTKKGAATAKASASSLDLHDMEALLKQHNKKFQPKAHYEPSLHSVRAVRMWERQSGRLWATLTTGERQAANSAIAKLLAEGGR